MTPIRSLALMLACLSLLACDQSPAPQPAPLPAPPKTDGAKPPQPAAPKAAPTQPVPLPKPTDDVGASPKPQVAAKPVAPAAVTKPSAKPPAGTSPARAPEPRAALDLSLPAELFDQLPPLQPASELPKALLPPLFGEKAASQSPFQLNGKLITNERVDDYWESLEGAELQFEFKQ